MTYDSWIKFATKELDGTATNTARLDALLLLEYVTGTERPYLLAHPETALSDPQIEQLTILLNRRGHNEPMAYILGKKEFYGRDFIVNKHVLVPRPETEDMIDLFLSLPEPNIVIDVGTGSGAIAITAKLEQPGVTVYATDNDQRCIAVAEQNAHMLGAEVTFIKTDIIHDINPEIILGSIVLANLPYVPEGYPLNEAAKQEPPEAIFSPDNGLSHYKRLFDQLRAKKSLPTAVVCEALEIQHQDLQKLALGYNLTLQTTRGLQMLFIPTELS